VLLTRLVDLVFERPVVTAPSVFPGRPQMFVAQGVVDLLAV